MKNLDEDVSLIQCLVQENDLPLEKAILVFQIVAEFAQQQLPVLRGNIQVFVQEELKGLSEPASLE